VTDANYVTARTSILRLPWGNMRKMEYHPDTLLKLAKKLRASLEFVTSTD
jgi:hypothetical protein